MGSGFWVIVVVTLVSLIAGAAGYFARTTNADPRRLAPTWVDIKDKESHVTSKIAAVGQFGNLFVSFAAGWLGYFTAEVLAKQVIVGSFTAEDGKVVESSQLYLNGALMAAVILASFQGASYLQKRIDEGNKKLIEKKQAANTVKQTEGLTRSGQNLALTDSGFGNSPDDPIMVISQDPVPVPLVISYR